MKCLPTYTLKCLHTSNKLLLLRWFKFIFLDSQKKKFIFLLTNFLQNRITILLVLKLLQKIEEPLSTRVLRGWLLLLLLFYYYYYYIHISGLVRFLVHISALLVALISCQCWRNPANHRTRHLHQSLVGGGSVWLKSVSSATVDPWTCLHIILSNFPSYFLH